MNISSLSNTGFLNNYYNQSVNKMNKSSERLSSGKRITRASDDIAGLMISERMKSQINGFKVGTDNLKSALDLVNVADKSLEQITNLAQSIKENYTKLGNDTLTADDKTIVEANITSLKTELTDIISNANFNNNQVFSGASKSIQSGANASDKMSITISDLSTLDFSDETTTDASLNSILTERGKIGAYQTSLEARINVNENSTEQLTNAYNRIIEVDIAKETIEYNKQDLLQKTAISMMKKQHDNSLSLLNILI